MNIEQTIKLDWFGPFKFKDFIEKSIMVEKFRKPGVYIWVEKWRKIKRLCYVGKASGRPTLLERQQEHYANFIGGRYNIPAEFRKCEKEWIPNQYPINARILLKEKEFIQLVHEAFAYIKNINIYLCPLGQTVPLKNLERNLLYVLQPSATKPGTKSPPPTRLQIQHKNARWATDDIIKQAKEPLIIR